MFPEINIHCLMDYTAHSNELGTFMKHEMTVYTTRLTSFVPAAEVAEPVWESPAC